MQPNFLEISNPEYVILESLEDYDAIYNQFVSLFSQSLKSSSVVFPPGEDTVF